MARIRTIKPEFWTSEQVMECSTTSRLLFIGMWNFCDDAGNHPASFLTLKAEVFPSDELKIDYIKELLEELIAVGLVEEYEAGGKRYWHVTGWHHQRIEKPNFKHPPHENRRPVEERSTTNRRPVEERSTPEGKCKGNVIGEGKGGKEQVHADPDPASAPEKPKRRAASAAVVFDPVGFLAERGVEQQTIADHFAVRKVKKQPPTETALQQFEREADKAGLSLQAAATECCARGWAGFKAEWLTNSQNGARAGPPPAQTGRQARIDNYWQEFGGNGEKRDTNSERDITGESVRIT